MQVLREVYNQQLVEQNGEFFLIESGIQSLTFDQETKDQFLKLSDNEFLVKAQETVARSKAVMMLSFYQNNR
jgi:hypothetical protein